MFLVFKCYLLKTHIFYSLYWHQPFVILSAALAGFAKLAYLSILQEVR